MAFDRNIFAVRLRKSHETLALSVVEIAQQTGISESHLEAYENANRDPTGDHVLILADFLRCDYRYLVEGCQGSRLGRWSATS